MKKFIINKLNGDSIKEESIPIKAKKPGIKIKVKGIKNLKLWSNVKEIDIQYKLVTK